MIHTFGLSVRSAQLYLFLFLFPVAAGTVIGGPIGDRIGTRRVIWWSILGVLPFTLALPYVGLFWTAILSVIIGLILASAHPAIIVYAQPLIPGRVGMVAGLFFGLAFGVAGIGAAFLGWLADATSITFVYHVCASSRRSGCSRCFCRRWQSRKSAGASKEVTGQKRLVAVSGHSDAFHSEAIFFIHKGSFDGLLRGPRAWRKELETQRCDRFEAQIRRFCQGRMRQRPSPMVNMA